MGKKDHLNGGVAARMKEDVDRIISSLGLDSRLFYQEAVIKQAENPFGGVWTTVQAHHGNDDPRPSVFSCLADPGLEHEILEGYDWLMHADSFSPGICESGDKTYYFSGQDDGYYFIVAEEHFPQMDESQLVLNQEFLLLFNLYRGDDGDYYSLTESGEKEPVVRFGEGTHVRTSYLMRYIAARQLLFVQFVDSRIASPGRYPSNAKVIHEENHESESCRCQLWFQSAPDEQYLLSMMHARSVVRPGPMETCDLWPFEHEETYPEFAIAERPDGTMDRFTCDPSKLGNYFGGNPAAPHYLTPVYFKPAVLDKYRKNPCFSVTERQLSCGGQWGVRIDNVEPSRVMVYLGDLGRDVPESERSHFLEYEMSPSGQSISGEVIASDFLGACVDPTGPISQLVVGRRRLDEAWLTAFGRSFYRDPHPDESDMEKLIRIPPDNSREEFDTVIVNLDKYVIEYIDEKNFPPSAEKGSINRLAVYLGEQGIDVDVKPLRDLQSIRSASTSHAKGKKYEKLKGSLLTGDNAKDVESLIRRIATMMNDIADALETDGNVE